MFSARAVTSVKPALSRAFSSTPRANVAKLTLVGRLPVDPVAERLRNDTLMVKYVVGDRVKEGSDFKTTWYKVTNFVTEGTYGAAQMQRLKKGAYVYVECNVKAKSITGSDDKTRVHYNFEQRTMSIISSPKQAEEGMEQSEHQERFNQE
ncbi:hypothetical protein FPQ18DRAFT_390102 [Pyronema domesticum]|nr:hypothetical protein FPQ18DRAFT_390102 [Pyronema domesticum]